MLMPPLAFGAPGPQQCGEGCSILGIVGTHPAVFVRVANKGVAGYGTWKKVRKMGDKGKFGRERAGELNAETQSAQRGRTRGRRARVGR